MELTVNGDLKTLLLSASERAPDQGLVVSAVGVYIVCIHCMYTLYVYFARLTLVTRVQTYIVIVNTLYFV